VFRFLLASLVSSVTLLAAAPEPHPLHHPLVFEPNRGQAPAPVKWIARGSGYQVFLTQEGLTMLVPAEAPSHSRPFPGTRPLPAKYNAIRMEFTGSRSWSRITGLEPTGGVSNYYSGGPGVSHENIPHFSRVSVADIYKGVDLVFYGNGDDLEYDLIVAPGADPSAIRLTFEGIERMRVDDVSGDLVLTTPGGTELRQFRPKVYQQSADGRVEIPGRYKFLGRNRAAFTLAAWDSKRPLVIDPTVSFTKFLAGEASDVAHGVAVDVFGNSYVIGETDSSHFPLRFPLVPGTDCDSGWSGFCSAPNTFITKLSPEGNIMFSTYYGVGSGYGIAVDSTGVYITGGISPVGDLKYPGKWEVFIGKLSVDGGKQIYYRIVGGSDNDFGTAIAVDSQQSAWVTGVTTSRDFPGQTNPPSLDEVILIKVDAVGTVIFSRAFGGNDEDEGYGIAVDRKGDPWITGRTCSPDFFATFDFSTGGCTSLSRLRKTARPGLWNNAVHSSIRRQL
jgi:Beta-propeller repeat